MPQPAWRPAPPTGSHPGSFGGFPQAAAGAGVGTPGLVYGLAQGGDVHPTAPPVAGQQQQQQQQQQAYAPPVVMQQMQAGADAYPAIPKP
jgi:hypothetical protein